MTSLIFLIILLLSGHIWIQCISKIFERRFQSRFVTFIFVLLFVFAFAITDRLGWVRLSILFMFAYFLIMTSFIFVISWINLFTLTLLYVLISYNVSGILAALGAIALDTTTHNILLNNDYRWIIYIITVILFMLFVVVFSSHDTFIQRQTKLYRNTLETKHLFKIEVLILFYLMIINDGRFLVTNQTWYNVLYASSCIFTLVILLVVWIDSYKRAELLETERYTSKIENQLRMQIEHYDSYNQLMEEFQKFKHDYRATLATIQDLIEEEQFGLTQTIISQTNEAFKHSLDTETYSRSHIIDAVIKNVEHRCVENNIQYTLDIQVPEILRISELDVLRLITNLVNNAIEALVRIEDPNKRKLNISSSVHNDLVIITFANTYAVEPIFKYGNYQSTKTDADAHGIGLHIVNDIVSAANGFLNIDVDRKHQCFKVTITI